VSADDKRTIAELEQLCARMTLEQLRRFCEGTLRAATVGQRMLREKFGDAAWQAFDDDVENGRIEL
jgi:hypothetical protein